MPQRFLKGLYKILGDAFLPDGTGLDRMPFASQGKASHAARATSEGRYRLAALALAPPAPPALDARPNSAYNQDMSHNGKNYQAMLRARGFRVTRQRQLILDAICEGGGHTTLEAIFARAHARIPTLNLATLYRNLDFLCRQRLVVAIRLEGDQTVYEIAGDHPHHHLICRACGALLTLDHEPVDAFFDQIRAGCGFQADMDHLALYGLCQGCAQAAGPHPQP